MERSYGLRAIAVAAVVVLIGSVSAVAIWFSVIRPRHVREQLSLLAAQIQASGSAEGVYPGTVLGSTRADVDLARVRYRVQPGQEILLVYKEDIGKGSNFRGYLVSTRPLLESDLVIDAYGRKVFPGEGLGAPELVPERRIDEKCWIVFFDLS